MADLYLLSYATAGGAALGMWLTWEATRVETVEGRAGASCPDGADALLAQHPALDGNWRGNDVRGVFWGKGRC